MVAERHVCANIPFLSHRLIVFLAEEEELKNLVSKTKIK